MRDRGKAVYYGGRWENKRYPTKLSGKDLKGKLFVDATYEGGFGCPARRC